MCPCCFVFVLFSFLIRSSVFALGRGQSGWFRRIDFGFELLFEESKTARGFVDPCASHAVLFVFAKMFRGSGARRGAS